MRATGSDQPFVTLSPRQAINNLPKASLAQTAETVLPSAFRDFPQGGMDGIVIKDATLTANKLAPGQVVKSLNGLTDAVKLEAGDGISILSGPNNTLTLAKALGPFFCTEYAHCYWKLNGNSLTIAPPPTTDTVLSSHNWLGTTDNQALELRAEGRRGLRIEPNNGFGGSGVGRTVNFIGGYWSNIVDQGVYSATIGGGGSKTGPNRVSGSYGTVAGGSRNIAGDPNNLTTLDSYPFVGGGFANQAQGYGSSISGGFRGEVASGTTNSAIAGGDRNRIGSSYSSIGGGKANEIFLTADHAVLGGGEINEVKGRYSSLVGGEWNRVNAAHSFIGGGYGNVIDDTASTIGGGALNHAYGHKAFIGGGSDNQAHNWGATVGGGAGNIAFAHTTTIPGGLQARADKFGQQAYASGQFANAGDAQSSLFVVRNTTSSPLPTELFLDGTGASERMTVAPDTTWTFKGTVVARTAGIGAQFGSWEITGVVNRNGLGVPTVCASPKTICDHPTGWNVAVVAVGPNSVAIKVTGSNKTIRWVASMTTSEVTFP